MCVTSTTGAPETVVSKFTLPILPDLHNLHLVGTRPTRQSARAYEKKHYITSSQAHALLWFCCESPRFTSFPFKTHWINSQTWPQTTLFKNEFEMQQISEYFLILTKLTKLTDKYFPDVSVPQRTTTTISGTESDRCRPAVLSTWWPLAIRLSTGTDLSAKLINATVHVWPAKHFEFIIKWAV